MLTRYSPVAKVSQRHLILADIHDTVFDIMLVLRIGRIRLCRPLIAFLAREWLSPFHRQPSIMRAHINPAIFCLPITDVQIPWPIDQVVNVPRTPEFDIPTQLTAADRSFNYSIVARGFAARAEEVDLRNMVRAKRYSFFAIVEC